MTRGLVISCLQKIAPILEASSWCARGSRPGHCRRSIRRERPARDVPAIREGASERVPGCTNSKEEALRIRPRRQALDPGRHAIVRLIFRSASASTSRSSRGQHVTKRVVKSSGAKFFAILRKMGREGAQPKLMPLHRPCHCTVATDPPDKGVETNLDTGNWPRVVLMAPHNHTIAQADPLQSTV